MGNNSSRDHMIVNLTFKKVVDQYIARLEKEDSNFKKLYISSVLRYVDDHEELIDGIKEDEIFLHKESISVLLSDLFPAALTLNEIKAATVPFSNILFNKTERLSNLLRDAGKDFHLNITAFESFDTFRMSCGIILNKYYNKSIDLSRPILVKIPDIKGYERTYRVTYNADFIDIELNSDEYRLSQEDIKKLLRSPNDEQLWENYFLNESYTFDGFIIVTFTDVTMDAAISDLKTLLLDSAQSTKDQTDKIKVIFRKIFNLENLRVGFTSFDHYERNFESMIYNDSESFLLGSNVEKKCKDALCTDSYQHLIKDFEPLVITDVADYASKIENTYLTDNLLRNDIHSAIFYPITKSKKLIGVLEIVSKKKFALNSFNVIKIESVAGYIKAALVRTEQEYENSIKALIQTECTSIHSSVQWKFEREARRILKARSRNSKNEPFKDVGFQDVYPLYGQIDIVGSSDARNQAIKKDLINQMDQIGEIFAFAKKYEHLPIYDQISYRVLEFRKELENGPIDANSQRDIIKLLNDEINPVIKHLMKLSPKIERLVAEYQSQIDETSGVIYQIRNDYDNTVQAINEALANCIDRKQMEAQEIFPHFFERFKTDGVEHNIYLGSSIAAEQEFNVVYLYNLRLWQLQTMIAMENQFYSVQENLPSVIEAASMILVFDNTLSIRYRIDEKRFDVDGTYNARYEVIKKRIDKANIKGTQERITQNGKIAIIYTNKETEREYMRYINFLQHNQLLGNEVEHLELEDVQGVVGLKALRVNVLYDIDVAKGTLTYEDLVRELHLIQ
ncbi:GAF domain-containing protein [Nonlabens sp. Ci31]|uniref:GAF domain-containing protein n=1 Tax=Nonlabens sp. Ci31 TaxID=2608253 RepID=UPI0014636A6D|nr:GAF domain-containing protein [Nonlabens sp. Ci31]QJP35535.1 GAF domain-containing protein [Nonlabens sp. Ci31]